jgi:MFS family permease
VGAMVGGVLLTAFGGRFAPRTLAIGGLICQGIAMLLAWNGPYLHLPLWYYLLVFALFGIPGVISFVGMATIFQNAAPRHMLGRLFALLNAIMGIATLLGMLVAGFVTDNMAPGLVLNLQALSFLGGAAVCAWLLRPAPAGEPSTAEPASPATHVAASTSATPD